MVETQWHCKSCLQQRNEIWAGVFFTHPAELTPRTRTCKLRQIWCALVFGHVGQWSPHELHVGMLNPTDFRTNSSHESRASWTVHFSGLIHSPSACGIYWKIARSYDVKISGQLIVKHLDDWQKQVLGINPSLRNWCHSARCRRTLKWPLISLATACLWLTCLEILFNHVCVLNVFLWLDRVTLTLRTGFEIDAKHNVSHWTVSKDLSSALHFGVRTHNLSAQMNESPQTQHGLRKVTFFRTFSKQSCPPCLLAQHCFVLQVNLAVSCLRIRWWRCLQQNRHNQAQDWAVWWRLLAVLFNWECTTALSLF